VARTKLPWFVGAGLVVAAALAFFVAPEASSDPDGLERVAIDEGFVDEADDHALADSPVADYSVEGVDDERLSTGLAGLLGVGATFLVGTGLLLAVRAIGRRPTAPEPEAEAEAATEAEAEAHDDRRVDRGRHAAT
jgi:cobalt/nickel transport system permease protein